VKQFVQIKNVLKTILILLGLFFLIQGFWHSQGNFYLYLLPVVIFLSFFLLPKYRNQILFVIVALGPFVNLTIFFKDLYFYPVEIVLFCFFFLWMIENINEEYQRNLGSIGVLFFLFAGIVLCVTTLQIVQGANIFSGIRLFRSVGMGIYFFLFLNASQNQNINSIKIFTKTTILSVLFIAIFALLQYFYSAVIQENFFREPNSVFTGSESLAIYLSISLPFIFFNRNELFDRLWNKTALFSFFLGIIALVLTRSRAGILALMILGLLFVVYFKKISAVKKLNRWITGSILLLVFAAAGAVLIKSFVLTAGRFDSVENLLYTLFSSRNIVWEKGIEYIMESPFKGHGLIDNVYNQYLQTAVQFGIPAFILFIIMIAKIIYEAINTFWIDTFKRKFLFGVLMAVLSLLAVSLAESTWGNQFSYMNWFFLFLLFHYSKSDHIS
jgi:O-antigen ligase